MRITSELIASVRGSTANIDDPRLADYLGQQMALQAKQAESGRNAARAVEEHKRSAIRLAAATLPLHDHRTPGWTMERLDRNPTLYGLRGPTPNRRSDVPCEDTVRDEIGAT